MDGPTRSKAVGGRRARRPRGRDREAPGREPPGSTGGRARADAAGRAQLELAWRALFRLAAFANRAGAARRARPTLEVRLRWFARAQPSMYGAGCSPAEYEGRRGGSATDRAYGVGLPPHTDGGGPTRGPGQCTVHAPAPRLGGLAEAKQRSHIRPPPRRSCSCDRRRGRFRLNWLFRRPPPRRRRRRPLRPTRPSRHRRPHQTR